MPDESRGDKLFEFYDAQKLLVVYLSRAALEEVFRLVQSKSGIAGLTDIPADQVSQIELYEDTSQVKESNPRRRLAVQVLTTIGFVGLQIAGLLIFATGIFTIVRLIWP